MRISASSRSFVAQGFEHRSIAGSSMGALVGGMSCGRQTREYRDWVGSLQRCDVCACSTGRCRGGGFIKGDRIIGALRDLIGETLHRGPADSLHRSRGRPRPQREVWLSQGSLFDAIRASIATPDRLSPVRYHGQVWSMADCSIRCRYQRPCAI